MSLVKVRRWGNSIGVVIPEEEAKKLKLHSGDTIRVEVRKVVPIESLFGSAKWKKSAQQIKDEMREGWKND